MKRLTKGDLIMQKLKQRVRGRHLLLTVLLSTIAFGLLVGCATSSEQAALQVPTEISTRQSMATNTVRAIPPVEATREAYRRGWTEYRTRRKTEVALTPTQPILTPVPQPTKTWELGLFEECPPPGNGSEPQLSSCWRGMFNGRIISVATGLPGRRADGTRGDGSQGMLMVFPGPVFNATASSTEFYSTPLRLGNMRILSVDGGRVTITPRDYRTPGPTATPGITFIFDLATRQWVNP